jgi:hypothetical protein
MREETLIYRPVLETRAGCREAVKTMTLAQRFRTAWLLGCENADSEHLTRAMHERNIRRRRRSCPKRKP